MTPTQQTFRPVPVKLFLTRPLYHLFADGSHVLCYRLVEDENYQLPHTLLPGHIDELTDEEGCQLINDLIATEAIAADEQNPGRLIVDFDKVFPQLRAWYSRKMGLTGRAE